jgi:hypothetical protein
VSRKKVVFAPSVTVTLSTRSHTIADTMANASAKPGLTTEPKFVDPVFSTVGPALALAVWSAKTRGNAAARLVSR